MQALVRNLSALTILCASSHAPADVIYSGAQNTPIPLTYDGATIDVDFNGTWDLNPYLGGVYLANNTAFQPARDGGGGMDTVTNHAAGVLINGGLSYATGMGGSIDHLGSTFTAGEEGYLGFKLGSNYGWMRVVFTNNTSGAVIKDWAYDTSGVAVATGNVLQSGSTITLDSSALGFTLGSQVTGSNSVVKTGSNTTTLTGINTYTGGTIVAAGVLAIGGSGSINSTSGVSIATGGTLRYNSSTALTVAPTLNGTGTGAGQRAVLGGTGPINVAVTLDNLGDVLSPGNSPGIQTYTVGQSWAAFSYDWELNNFTGTTAGTAFDQIGITGGLTLSGGSGSYILNVLGLTAGDVAGPVPNFSEINRSWTILSSTGILTGFNAANWTINTTGFTDPDTGTWLLAQSGNNLVLSYTIIPEPGTALLGGLGLLMLLRRRRQ